ncbi:MAG: transglutaminase domain-containing protein [Pirellulales bacterium]
MGIRPRFLCCLLPAACCLLLLGCKDDPPSRRGSSPRSQSGQQGALLGAVATQLGDLPNANVLELRPPVVVLDSSKSSDGQDVMALVSTHPEAPAPPIYNYLHVPGNNARFRNLGVRSGDMVKLFQMKPAEDREDDDDAIAVEVEEALELTVAQVLNDNALLFEGGLDGATLEPLRIEVWRFVDTRMEQIAGAIRTYVAGGTPAVGWEPTPDQTVLNQIVERLNQWLRGIKLDSTWQPAKLLATLPSEPREAERLQAYLSPAALSRPTFESYEGRLVQEAIWCRDISRWVRGSESNRLGQAERLFDWVVRNVQLEADEGALPRRPWQALVYGRGTAAERAWLMTVLCRQAGMDAVVLTAASADGGVWLCVGVVLEGQVYLFDPRLGLPVPGPDGQGVATLAQARADDRVLRQLDLEDAKYPVTSSDLAKTTVNLVADQFSLAHRAAMVEERLAGEDAVKLSAPVDAMQERLQSLDAGEVRLWGEPFRSLKRQLELDPQARAQSAGQFLMFAWRPALWKARSLHFRGMKELPESSGRDVLTDPIDDHRDAARLYMDKSVRPTEELLQQQTSPEKQMIYSTAKSCATYWLGLLNYDDASDEPSRLENALRWFEMVFEQPLGKQLWPGGVPYNSARTLQELGRKDDAIQRLQEDTSPQKEGNQILARQWESMPDAAQPAEGASDSAEGTDQ